MKKLIKCSECISFAICNSKLIGDIERLKSNYGPHEIKNRKIIIELAISNLKYYAVHKKDCRVLLRMSNYEILLEYNIESEYYDNRTM